MDEQNVIFELNNEAYGLNVRYVQSIIHLPEIITVPNAPPLIKGIINLNNTAVPVVDLRDHFGLQAEGEHKAVIIIIELDALKVGLIVDKVLEVVKIFTTAIESPSPLLVSTNTAYLRGIAKLKERLVILLDPAKIFSPNDLQLMSLNP